MAAERLALAAFSALALTGCSDASGPWRLGANGRDALVGAWRSQIQATNGALAQVKDLQFMYAFNAGGTLTESSNIDGAPPAPPAYGVWRHTGPRVFEARYAFFVTRPPESFDAIKAGGGWAANGNGVVAEKITLAEDGQSFASSMTYSLFDPTGKPAGGGGEAHGVGVRIGF